MSEKSAMHEFITALFDNEDPKKFLLFQKNYRMMLCASGTLTVGAKIQYLRTLTHEKALCEFETL